MLKYCRDKWEENKDKLEKALREDDSLNDCDYSELVAMVVKHILNPGENNYNTYDSGNITVIDDGHYQGTLLFMIPMDTYQPSEYEYLLTYVGYGSCSGCDTLKSIQDWGDKKLTDSQVKDFMGLCKDLVCNIVKPYNGVWINDDRFTEVAD